MKIKDAKWEMTDDEVGMKPKFRVWCLDCIINFFLGWLDVVEGDFEAAARETLNRMNQGYFDMLLRECFCSPLSVISDKAYHNDMHYKCCLEEGCDRVKVFGVPIDKEYYLELMKRRNGKQRILPRKQWEEHQGIQRQLEGLGYI